MVMGKGGPGVAIGGVVLPHGAPLALGQVTAPEGPGLGLPITLDKPLKFGNLAVLYGDAGNGGAGHRSNTLSSLEIRRALAITVRPGPTAGQLGKTLASAIVRLATSWLRPSRPTTEVAGFTPMRQVPQA